MVKGSRLLPSVFSRSLTVVLGLSLNISISIMMRSSWVCNITPSQTCCRIGCVPAHKQLIPTKSIEIHQIRQNLICNSLIARCAGKFQVHLHVARAAWTAPVLAFSPNQVCVTCFSDHGVRNARQVQRWNLQAEIAQSFAWNRMTDPLKWPEADEWAGEESDAGSARVRRDLQDKAQCSYVGGAWLVVEQLSIAYHSIVQSCNASFGSDVYVKQGCLTGDWLVTKLLRCTDCAVTAFVWRYAQRRPA